MHKAGGIRARLRIGVLFGILFVVLCSILPIGGGQAFGTPTARAAVPSDSAAPEAFLQAYIGCAPGNCASNASPNLKRINGVSYGADFYKRYSSGYAPALDQSGWSEVYGDVYKSIAEIDCSTVVNPGKASDIFGGCGTDVGLMYNFALANYMASNKLDVDAQTYITAAATNISTISLHMALAYMGILALQTLGPNPPGETKTYPASNWLTPDTSYAPWPTGVMETWADVERDVDTKNSKRMHKVYNVKVTNSGGSPDVSYDTYDDHLYGTLGAYYSDFSAIKSLVDSLNPAAGGSYDAAKLTAGYTTVMASYTSPTNKAGDSSANNDPNCGSASYSSGIVKVMLNSLCGGAVVAYDFSLGLVASSARLYEADAGISSSPAPVSGLPTNVNAQMFDHWIDASGKAGIVGKFQDSMVSTTESGYGSGVRNGYLAVLSLLNSLLIVAFIIMAGANILQIGLSQYAIKKVLPGLVIGFILATGSWYMIRVLLEFSSVIPTAFPTLTSSNIGEKFTKSVMGIEASLVDTSGADAATGLPPLTSNGHDVDPAKLLIQIVLNIAILAAGILLFWLALLFIVRNVVFAFLVPLAPLAFLGASFAPLNKVWTKWWAFMSGWLWMPVVSNFWIWMALAFFNAGSASTGVGSLVMYVAAVLFLWAAVKTPFSMAGEASAIMNKVGKVGNNVVNAGKGALGAAALTYTPAGMAMRAYNQFSAQNKEKRSQLMQGDIVKNRIGRALGGNTLNRAVARRGINIDQDKRDQEKLSAQVKGEAEEQLARGALRTAGDRLEKMGGIAGRLGEGMNEMADMFNTANFEKILREETHLGFVSDLMANKVRRMTYAGREDQLMEVEQQASRSSNAAKREFNKSFSEARGNTAMADRRKDQTLEDLVLKQQVEDQQGDRERETYQRVLFRLSAKSGGDIKTLDSHEQDLYKMAARKVSDDIRKKTAEQDGVITASDFAAEGIDTQAHKLLNGGAGLTQADSAKTRHATYRLIHLHNMLKNSNTKVSDLKKAAAELDALSGRTDASAAFAGIGDKDDQKARQVFTAAYEGTATGTRLEELRKGPDKAFRG